MFTLTLKDVLIKGREAINAGTLQGQYNFIYKDLMEYDGNVGACSYRFECNGIKYKCIVGTAIPDEVYDKDWDIKGRTISYLLNVKLIQFDGSNEERAKLTTLQSQHDNISKNRYWDEFINYFESLEKEYKLAS